MSFSRRAKSGLAALLALCCAVARGDVSGISIADATGNQSATVQTYMPFQLSRSGDTNYRVAVGYEAADGTANWPTHYYKTSGVLVFEAGASTAELRIKLTKRHDPTELTFYLNLLYATGFGPPPQFTQQQSFATGDSPAVVQVADVNGDDKPDLVTVNRTADTVSVLLNTMSAGAATAAFATQQTVATGDNPVGLALADLNGDGRVDLIVGHDLPNLAKQVSVHLNATVPGLGTIAFGSGQTFAVGDNGAIVVTDLNTDGKPDLVAANNYDKTVSLLLNTTVPGALSATFASEQLLAMSGHPLRTLAVDVNTDGRDDLVVGHTDIYGAMVFLNATASGASTAGFGSAQQVGYIDSAADLNQDGLVDLYYGGSVQLNATVPGSTTVSFQPIYYTYGFGGLSDAADLNGDDLVDLVVPGAVAVSRVPAGSDFVDYATAVSFALTASPDRVFAHDLNADGKPDLIGAIANTDSVAVLLNTLPDEAFNPAQYDAVLDDAQAVGTIVPKYLPVGGHGGSSLDAWVVITLLALAVLRAVVPGLRRRRAAETRV